MIGKKRNNQADFADFLSALDRVVTDAPVKVAANAADVDAAPVSPAVGREAAPHPAHRLRRFLGSVAWPWRFRGGGNPSESAAAYAAEAADAAELQDALAALKRDAPEPPKAPSAQSEDEAIAEELGLRADLADVDLKQMRREFAKKNHPDRFGPAQQMRAARRMSIANMLIDQHLKQKTQA